MDWLNLTSLGGCIILIGLAWLTGSNRRVFPWKLVILGSGTLFTLGVIVFWLPVFRKLLLIVNQGVLVLVSASAEGARFLFGPLALDPGESGSLGVIVAFQVLPAVVFFSVITSWLYYIGVLPALVRLMAKGVRRGFGLSGAESLAATSNIFVGIESALIIRPYLERMTRSELLMVLTAGLSTIASTVLAFYVSMLYDVFPLIAGHLISTSVLSIPAAVLMAKLILPEEEQPETLGNVPPTVSYVETHHWMGSIIYGAMEGVKLAVGIGALLIGLLGLVKLLDVILLKLTGFTLHSIGIESHGVDLKTLLKFLAYPLTLCLGIQRSDWSVAAQLLGERWILTEVVSYRDLAQFVHSGAISPRSMMVLSYALCGFTHIPSVAIFIGGISALAPSRRDDIARLGGRALWAATLTTILTGAVAGVFYHGQAGLIR